MKIGVIRFPGTNCDRDVAQACELAGLEPEYVWWSEAKLTDYDGIVIPGGFSYGDYLRAGAMASITPVIDGIKELVKEEKPVLKEAEAVDGAFLATAKDVLWREDLFDDWHFYDIAECFEMRRNGYHVKLYADTEPWILHESTLRKDPEDRYGRYCSVFLKKIKKIENRG